jgi:histidinol-phosphatase (PHP family)
LKLFNLHTHSIFCDGKSYPEAYAKEALRLGFHTLGFSSHAPVPFTNNFSIRDDLLQEYAGAVCALKKQYAGQINILLGLEIDYIPGITRDFGFYTHALGLEYTIGGIHLVRKPGDDNLWFIDGPWQETWDEGLEKIFHGDIKEAVSTYYEQLNGMVMTQKPSIVAHLDKIKMHNRKRYFSGDESWYRDLVEKSLRLIAEKGCIIEVNTRGLYKKRCDELYPGTDILKQIKQMGIPVTLSSDAHRPEELAGYMTEAIDTLREIGFTHLSYFGEGGWRTQEMA